MDPSNLNAMLVTASELAMESRWREAVEIARKAVVIAPSEYKAWWLLAEAYDKLGRSSDAVHAYAECYRHAPRQDDLRAIRSFAAKRAGIPFEEGDDAGDDRREEVVNFVVTIGGKRMLVQAHNDSGRTLEEVVDAAETLIQSPNPFDAWVHAEKHRELFSALADTVLSALAQAQPEARARAGVERYRDALRRVRSGEGVLPFAEMAQIDEAEFLAFVTAVDDLQPVIQELAAATTDADRDAILGDIPS